VLEMEETPGRSCPGCCSCSYVADPSGSENVSSGQSGDSGHKRRRVHAQALMALVIRHTVPGVTGRSRDIDETRCVFLRPSCDHGLFERAITAPREGRSSTASTCPIPCVHAAVAAELLSTKTVQCVSFETTAECLSSVPTTHVRRIALLPSRVESKLQAASRGPCPCPSSQPWLVARRTDLLAY
jgi:hypothetical protein